MKNGHYKKEINGSWQEYNEKIVENYRWDRLNRLGICSLYMVENKT